MTDLPGVLAPWMMLTAQDLRTAAEDGDDSGAPDARPAAARVIVDPLVAEGTLVVAGGMEIALRRLSYLIAPAGWSVPSLLQGERVYPLPFSEPILNLADASLAAYGLSQYQVTIEWLDGVTGNICWRSKRTLTCDASVSSVSIASLVPGTPSNVVQRVVPIDPTTPDGVPLALTGGKIGEYTGTTDHRGLTHRDAPDQHPMDAITGLGGALDDAAAAGQAAVIAHAAAPDPHPQYTTTGEAAAAAPVQSVAGRTGAVTLSAADVAGLAEATQDAVAAMLASGANVTLTYDDAADRLTVSASGGDAELMRDTLGAALVGVGGVVVTPDDAADTITISLTGVPIAAISGLQAALDARVLGTDPRLSDPRTPTAHAATHAAGGTDALAVTSLGVGTLADGQYLMRSGTALVGGVPSGGGGLVVDTYAPVGAAGTRTSYTWTKPAGAKMVHFILVGAGGGGGSGRVGAAGTVRTGGGGGAGGGSMFFAVPADSLPSSIEVQVGKGGAGGAAVTDPNSGGLPGGTGPSTHLIGAGMQAEVDTGTASGGGGGGQGSASGGPIWYGGGYYDYRPIGAPSHGTGGAGSSATTMNGGTTTSGGASGGGITASDVVSAGGGGSTSWHWAAGRAPSGGAAGGGAGGAGYRLLNGLGYGGAGGGSSITSAGGAGGAGALYGGGGAGGGAALNGFASGAGGAGGDGVAVIVTYL